MTTRAKKATAPKRDRSGYYALPTGERLMSVTTILSNGVPKPALVHWAAREVAQSAVDNIPTLAKVRGETARAQAFDWLRKAAEAKRDAAANLGSAIHAHIEAMVLGQPAPEPTEEQRPFVEAFYRFVADFDPEWEATEMTVAHPGDGWAGTLDGRCTLRRRPDLGLVVLDWKTGKGVYGEAALQLSAYRRAPIGFTRDGTQVDLPPADGGVVVHLRPDGMPGGSPRGYQLYAVDTSDEVYACFRAAQAVALQWVKGIADTCVGKPLAVPEIEEVPV